MVRKVGEPRLIRENRCTWLVTEDNHQSLIHWLALNVPRRKILEYCAELGLKVPGSCLGRQMQALANFKSQHKDEILVVYDAIRATAMEDAQQRRQAFLDEAYAVRDMLREEMMTDRDNSGRTHMVRDYIHLSNAIADIEGFKRGGFDPKQQAALNALTKYMYGDEDAKAPVEPKVTVLQRPELPSGERDGAESAPIVGS